jgi:tetratricopeptide (TPR) repeat protein
MRALGWALTALLAALATAAAAAAPIHEQYDSPLGRVAISARGASVRGVLVAPSRACGFAAGEEVLRATLLDDSLAGEVRVCLSGPACREREEWASAVLLVGERALSGAVHVRAKGCHAPVGKRGGLAFTRASDRAKRAKAAPRVERARALLRDGGRWLAEGSFERARQRFLDAIAIDASLPEAYNGVGVTYRMRNDLPRALEWYKKALAVDADFGDAYYNMACAYALDGEKDLALRYLQIAALNGYATAGGIGEDPDLESLRDDPAYRALVKVKM